MNLLILKLNCQYPLNKTTMSSRRHEIEVIIEEVVESIILDTFESNFTNINEIEFALSVLKDRIQNLEIEDFEHLLDD